MLDALSLPSPVAAAALRLLTATGSALAAPPDDGATADLSPLLRALSRALRRPPKAPSVRTASSSTFAEPTATLRAGASKPEATVAVPDAAKLAGPPSDGLAAPAATVPPRGPSSQRQPELVPRGQDSSGAGQPLGPSLRVGSGGGEARPAPPLLLHGGTGAFPQAPAGSGDEALSPSASSPPPLSPATVAVPRPAVAPGQPPLGKAAAGEGEAVLAPSSSQPRRIEVEVHLGGAADSLAAEIADTDEVRSAIYQAVREIMTDAL